jgi:integrase
MSSVSKRARGVWRIYVELGTDVNGKRLRQITDFTGTKKEAQAELARILHERATGQHVSPSKVTLTQFLDRWLNYMHGRVGESTLVGYRDIIEARWKPALGTVRMQELTVEHITRQESAWLRSGRRGSPRRGAQGVALSGKTVLNYHRVLQQALRDAVQWHVIPFNPADDAHMRPPTYTRKPQPSLDLDSARRLKDALLADQHGVILYVMLTTGLRAGEAIALRWQDIDADAAMLSVRQAYSRVLKQVSQTKTHRSERPISLDLDLVALLRWHKAEQAKLQLQAGQLWQTSGLVFTDKLGGSLTHSTLRHALDRCLLDAGLEHISPHGLRHTHASLLVRLGTHMRVIQERLGHASFSITADTYSHIQPGMDAEAAAQLGRALKGAAQ